MTFEEFKVNGAARGMFRMLKAVHCLDEALSWADLRRLIVTFNNEVDGAFIRLQPAGTDGSVPDRLIGIVNIAGLAQRT